MDRDTKLFNYVMKNKNLLDDDINMNTVKGINQHIQGNKGSFAKQVSVYEYLRRFRQYYNNPQNIPRDICETKGIEGIGFDKAYLYLRIFLYRYYPEKVSREISFAELCDLWRLLQIRQNASEYFGEKGIADIIHKYTKTCKTCGKQKR